MAKNYMAYEAAQVVYGNNIEEMKEVGSRFPLFTRTVAMCNSEYLLDLLKAIPKVSARVVETGLAGAVQEELETEEVQEQEVQEEKKKTAKKEKPAKKEKTMPEPEQEEEEEAEEETEQDYSTMTAKKLYELCCKRGLSSKCKKRDKNSLIAVLKEADGAGAEEDEEDWEEEEEEQESPYAGKSAKELFGICKKRGIKCPTGKKADYYVELLTKDDAKKADSEEDEDDGDEWEID